MSSQHKFTTGDGLVLWGMFLFVLAMIDVLEPRFELYARGALAAVGVVSVIVGAARSAATWDTRGVRIACGAAALMIALGYGTPGTRMSLPSAPLRVTSLIIGAVFFLVALIFAIREELTTSADAG